MALRLGVGFGMGLDWTSAAVLAFRRRIPSGAFWCSFWLPIVELEAR